MDFQRIFNGFSNIMVGIMSHASLFPCTWCYASKNELDKCGTYRTIGNTMENYLKWCDAGSKKENAKNFKNCVNPPIFTYDEDKTFLEIISPPELHLMLGVVNTLYTNLLKESEQDALRWAKQCCVFREVYHGSSSFNGNSCRTLLRQLDVLRSNSHNLVTLKYVKAFSDFAAVVTACFSLKIDPSYKNKIAEFKKSFLDLGIPITPKIHAVFFHVPDFCDEYQNGLGFYTEQAMESVHSDFKNVWKRYKVAKGHPDYSEKLRRALCEYNSLHSF